ncbi:hypothetical protein [Olivibacter sp. XZL3]|uniref:hypothetical protein n=1 Tax=Olivibacter sp. XZL3 TaxID=1735116 RepID=UPI001065C1A1|nr:hypothetical protein [Olivibacter sp. XZL3]
MINEYAIKQVFNCMVVDDEQASVTIVKKDLHHSLQSEDTRISGTRLPDYQRAAQRFNRCAVPLRKIA